MKLQNLQLFVTIPAALYLGKEITNYKIYGTFFSYRTKKFYVRQHRNKTGLHLDYYDLPEIDQTNPCECEITNPHYMAMFDAGRDEYYD